MRFGGYGWGDIYSFPVLYSKLYTSMASTDLQIHKSTTLETKNKQVFRAQQQLLSLIQYLLENANLSREKRKVKMFMFLL